jgi:AMIN domain
VQIVTPFALLEFYAMAAMKNLCGILVVTLVVASATVHAQSSAVRRVTVVSQNPLQLQIQTSPNAVPQTQMISGPDRLVIDIPNTTPAATLRGITLNRGEVKGVRVSLFSATPPVTRIVVDLNSPQTYRVVPNAAGLLVSLGNDSESAAKAPASDAPATSGSPIGWVAPNAGVRIVNVSASVASVSARKNLPNASVPANGVRVQFADGLLSIQANGASLSEVLFQVQKVTGAEIAIPSGTEQDRVAANFGPGTAGDVLGELLNGSGMNFVVVGSETDPKVLRSVILTRKSDAPTAPVAMPQAYVPDAAENIPQDGPEMAPPPDDSSAPQAVPTPPDAGASAPPPTQ